MRAIAAHKTYAPTNFKYNGPMSGITDEFLEIAKDLDSIISKFDSPDVSGPLERLETASNRIKKAWSGSWLGYQSRVYYRDFQTPPPGAHFSQEWGMMSYFTDGTTGEWREYKYDTVTERIYELAGQPDLTSARALAKHARSLSSDKRTEITSLITTAQSGREDPFLSRLTRELDEIAVPTATNIVNGYLPRGQFITKDTVALGQGFQSPPHLDVWSDVMALRIPAAVCETLSKIAQKAAAHLVRQDRYLGKDRGLGKRFYRSRTLSRLEGSQGLYSRPPCVDMG